MSDIQDLQDIVVKFRNDRDWKQFHNPKDVALSLVLEAAELMEHFQWKSEAEIAQYLKTHKEDVADELVDVFYWVLLIAKDLSIDLNEAMTRKMKQNEAKYPVSKAKGNHAKYTELSKE